MKKIPAVSVIVPMYNAEKYIAECLESFLAQTFTDFELIVVDDCSTDNSVAIVESYAEKFGGRLKIFRTQKNLGTPGSPRNKGLLLSRGKYIFFADADDLLAPTALEELYALAESYGADVVYCEKFYALTEDRKLSVETDQNFPLVEKPTFETENLARRVENLLNGRYRMTPWLKFVRRDFLIENEIFFPHTRTAQDSIWTHALIFRAKKILRVPNAVYVYRLSENSIQRKKRSPEDLIKLWLNPVVFGLKSPDELMNDIEFFRENPQYRYAVLENFIHTKMANVFSASLELSPAEIYNEIRREFGKNFGDSEILISCLLTDLIEQQKIFVANRDRIAELEARLVRE